MGSSLGELATPHDRRLVNYSGETVAIDGYIVLYQFLTGIRDHETGDYVRNQDDVCISHLIGMMNRFSTVLSHGIQPILVLDGGAPDLKAEVLASRDDRQETAEQKYREAKERGDTEAMQQWGRQKVRVTDDILESTKRLCRAMGIPTLTAPTEGEPQATQLVKDGIADHVVSEDHDTLMYKAPTMVKDFSSGVTRVLSYDELLRNTGYTPEEVLWYGILRGTDYNDSPYGVGSVYGRDIIDSCESFAEVIDRALEYDDSIDPERWWEVKAWFEDPDVHHNPDIEFGTFDREATERVLIDDYGLLESQVQNRLSPIDAHEAHHD